MESGVYTLKIIRGIRVIRAKKQPDKLAVNPYNIPNMMKTLIHTLLPAALLLLLLTATACEDTLTTPAATIGHGDGPTLTLGLDNNEEKAGTRSTLNDGAPVNHVETVRILVFKGTGDDATYVGDEVYANEVGAIEWPDEKPDKITYQMNYAFVEGETYTLLGVGQDDNFAGTYKFIDNNDKTDIKTGTTLSNAYAILNEEKSPKECDFYTGTTTFTHEGKNTHIDDLLMKRRVAGVMLYVNEIPADLPHNNTNYRTTRVDLKLGRTQKKSVQLYRDFLAENWTEPEGEDLTDSNVLLSIDLSELNYKDKDEQGFYTIDNTTSANGLQNGALKAACYMLPLNVPTGNAADYKTFTVEIYGVENSDGQGSIATENGEGTTTPKTPELLKSFTVEQRNTQGAAESNFPIRSNYLYSIGKYNPEEGVDEPISLSGSPIYLEVLPFQKLDVNHEFGEARVQALFDDTENPIHNCINEEFTIKILSPLTTIRGQVTEIRLDVLPQTTYVIDDNGNRVLLSEDHLSDDQVEAEKLDGYYRNWLYIRTKYVENNTTQNTYNTQHVIYNKKNGVDINNLPEVTLFIRDYARPRMTWGWGEDGQWIEAENEKWSKYIQKDIRSTTLLLTTTIEGVGERTDTMSINQYNTITVAYCGDSENADNSKTLCGFSRKDMFEVTNDEEVPTKYEWGYWNDATTNISIYSGDGIGSKQSGAYNLNNIKTINTDTWNGSSPDRANISFKELNADYTIHESEVRTASNNAGTGWYLPAEYELEGLMIMSTKIGNDTEEQCNSITRINKGSEENYSTSTTAGTTAIQSDDAWDYQKFIGFCYYFDDQTNAYSHERKKLDRGRIDNTTTPRYPCYIRQARKFYEYSDFKDKTNNGDSYW